MPTLTTDLLEIAYLDQGPRDGSPVLLLHGWPDDATTWDGVTERLNAAGRRTIAPFLRERPVASYGITLAVMRFGYSSAMRSPTGAP